MTNSLKRKSKCVLVHIYDGQGFTNKAYHFETMFERLQEGDYVTVSSKGAQALGRVKTYSVLEPNTDYCVMSLFSKTSAEKLIKEMEDNT